MHKKSEKIKNKKIGSYIIAFINFLYLALLISRLNNNKFYTIIFIIFLVLFVGIYLFNKWLKNVNFDKIIKKRNQIFILTFIISLTIFLIGFKFFCADFKNVNINFENKNNIFNYINNIQLDNVIYEYKDGCFIGNYETNCTNKIKFVIEDNVHKFNISKSYKIIINFNYNAENMLMHINGEKIKINENNYNYVVTNNYKYDFISIIYGIFSLELIAFIVYILITGFIGVNEKDKKIYIIVFIFAFVIGIFNFYNSQIGIKFPDSYSYIAFDFHNFFKLIFDDRTPVYPFLIKLIKYLFVDNYLIWLCLTQYILWFVSILCFYKIINLLSNNVNYSCIFSIIYALCPAIVGWNNVILTESLAISGTVIFTYNIIKYIKYNNLKNGFMAVIISLILTFERPTSLILVIFLLFFWLLRFLIDRKNIKNDFKCFIGSIISLIIIIIYAFIFHESNGIYSLSKSLVRQDLIVNIQEGYYLSSSNKDFIKLVKNSMEKNNTNDPWIVLQDVYAKYSLKEVNDINKECRLKNLKLYKEYIRNLIKNNSHTTFSSYSTYNYHKNWLITEISLQETFSYITFASAYLAIILQFISLLYYWLKEKKIPWINIGLFSFPLVIIMSSFIGTCGEFMRTAICALPFTYISYIYLISKIIKLEKD